MGRCFASLFCLGALSSTQAAAPDCDSWLSKNGATTERVAIQEWRVAKDPPKDPMEAFRQSGYLGRITGEHAAKNAQLSTSAWRS